MRYKIEYEVYRYKKWWKNNFIITTNGLGTITNQDLIDHAYEKDQGEIRNLTFKKINYSN